MPPQGDAQSIDASRARLKAEGGNGGSIFDGRVGRVALRFLFFVAAVAGSVRAS